MIGETAAAAESAGDRKILALLTLVTAAALAAALWLTKGVSPLRSDSASYIYFDPSRTVGYPAFLWFVRTVTGNIGLAVPAQMLLLAGSLLMLGWSFYRISGRPVPALIFQLLLVCSPELWKISAVLLTESLATACVALWCSQVLRTLKTPSPTGTGQLVAWSALGTMVRPSLVALFFGAALLVLTVQPASRRIRTMTAIAAALILSWSATPLAHRLVDGSPTTSPFARGVLQHTLFCAHPGHPKDADAHFVEQYARPVAQYVATSPSDLTAAFERTYSGQLRFGLIIPALGRRHNFDAGWQTDPIVWRIATQRIADNPLCYAESVLAADYRMATYGTFGAEKARMLDYLAMRPPAPVPSVPLLSGDKEDALRAAQALHVPPAFPIAPRFRPDGANPAFVIAAVRLLFGGAAGIGLLSMFLLAGAQRWGSAIPNMMPGMAALGVAFHGVIGITAIVELGLSRYLVPLWPIMPTMLGLMVVGLAQLRSSRIGERVAPAYA